MIVLKPASGTNSARAQCQMTDSVGDFVYFSGPKIGADYQVARADNKLLAKMPAVGVIIAKPAPNVAVVQFRGEVGVYTGLTPGKLYFVGDTGQAVVVPPSPTLPGEKLYSQIVGVASDSGKLMIDLQKLMHVRVGP